MRAAYPVGGVTEAVLIGGDVRRPAEHLAGILAIDRHLNVANGRNARELDLEVEAGAGEDLCFVEGIDRLAGGGGSQSAQRDGGADDRQHATRVSSNGGRRTP